MKRAKRGKTPGSGRRKGTPNKLSSLAREAIAQAAAALGGTKRLTEWAKENPENESAFWTRIYPRLMPIEMSGLDGGPIGHYLISETPMSEEEWEKQRAGKA